MEGHEAIIHAGGTMKNTANKEILLICQGSEGCRNLAFLLRLAGYRFRMVNDLMEGINHIFNCQFNLHPLDLIIVDGHALSPGDIRGARLLQELVQNTALLIVEGSLREESQTAREILPPNVANTFYGRPEEVVGEVERILWALEAQGQKKQKNTEDADMPQSFSDTGCFSH